MVFLFEFCRRLLVLSLAFLLSMSCSRPLGPFKYVCTYLGRRYVHTVPVLSGEKKEATEEKQYYVGRGTRVRWSQSVLVAADGSYMLPRRERMHLRT